MNRAMELENKDLCRVCLTQDEDVKFLNIFETSNLQIELLSIGNIEVFESDGMPKKICEICRSILEKFYKFKQICKRSDTLLKMYPITGNIPTKLELPPELIGITKPPIETPTVESIEVETQTEETLLLNLAYEDEDGNLVPSMKHEEQEFQIFEVDAPEIAMEPPPTKSKIEIHEVKILNKATTNDSKINPKHFKKPTTAKAATLNTDNKPAPKILNSVLKIKKMEPEQQQEDPIQYLTVTDVENQLIAENDLIVNTPEDSTTVHVCDVCDKTFPLLQQLEVHKINHERVRDHPCNLCDKSFFSKYDLNKHMVVHTKQRDYTCIVCNKSFSRTTLLYRHEKIHTDPSIPRYKCEDCDRVYLNIVDYEKHSKTHQKNRPFQCKFCDKSFVFKQGLERHETIHDTESMQFSCQYCHIKLPTAAQLQRHLSADHIGEKKFPCQYCLKRFTMSHHLHRHLRKKHNNEEYRSYQCSECEEIMSNRSSYFAHCEKHAESSLNCPLCKENLKSSNWKQHVAGHASSDVYLCDHCSLVYVNSDDLEIHLMNSHANENDMLDEDSLQYLVDDEKNDDMIEYEEENIAFVEYVEPPPAKKSRRSKRVKTPENDSDQEIEKKVVKMSRENIERLKKQGKIKIINGEMIMMTTS